MSLSPKKLKIKKLKIKKLKIKNFVDIVHSYYNGLGSLWKGYLIHHICFLGNFCIVLFIL
jgi:hypothetical protein